MTAGLVVPFVAGLDLAGRRVVVVGGGSRAQRKLPALLAAGADVLLVAPEVTPAVEGMVSAGELVWEPRRYRRGDLDGAWFALVCTTDSLVDKAVAAEAADLRVFCSLPDGGVPGTVGQVAVGTHDGAVLAVLAPQHRRAEALRTALIEALQSGAVADATEPPLAGVALVGGGPGDRDLITVRGRRLLAQADVVITDRLAPRDLLDELGGHVEVIDASKIPYGRAMAQGRINELLIEHARAGRFVVRLKGGDPFVYGRGYEEVIACAEAGVTVTVVPGVTSAFAAPAMAGVPVSHRSVVHEIVVVSGHVAPDDPRSLVDWPALGRLRGTIVLMMAVERIGVFAAELMRHGRPGDTPVVIVQDATTQIQRTVRGTLADIGRLAVEQEVRPPAIVVIGAVAGLDPTTTSWTDAAESVR